MGKGFRKWIRGVEGHDDLSSSQETGAWVHAGYDLLHQFLQRRITGRKYRQYIWRCSDTERLDATSEKRRLNVSSYDVDSLGLYSGDPSAYSRSVEYLSGHQEGQRQERNEETTQGPSPYSNSLYDIRPIGEYLRYLPPDSTPSTPRSRAEPVGLSESDRALQLGVESWERMVRESTDQQGSGVSSLRDVRTYYYGSSEDT